MDMTKDSRCYSVTDESSLSLGRDVAYGHSNQVGESGGCTQSGHAHHDTVYGHISRQETVNVWLMSSCLLVRGRRVRETVRKRIKEGESKDEIGQDRHTSYIHIK